MKISSRTAFVSLLLGLTLVLITVTAAFAAQPLTFQMVVEERIDPGLGPDPFTTFGPAYDAGLVCYTGSVIDLDVDQYRPPQGSYTYFKVLKHFSCDDESGSFDIQMKVKLDNATGSTTARWKFAGGTGDYANLNGHGTLIGIPIVQGTSILDIYDGTAH